MRLDELNWMDVEKYLASDDRLIFVLGACEQHGFLSLLTDVKVPQALADAASRQTGVLVAPSVNFGISPYFLAYPGTLSLRLTTFVDLVEDLVRSAYKQGFRRFLFLNGHGGNDPARARLYELANQLIGMRLSWYAWWVSHSVELVAQKYDLIPAHANWLEAFAFTQVAELPDGEKAPPVVQGLLDAEEARAVYGDGSFGGRYQVDEVIMDELFTACLADVLQLLGDLS
jgi:creatinine amidohydrolase